MYDIKVLEKMCKKVSFKSSIFYANPTTEQYLDEEGYVIEDVSKSKNPKQILASLLPEKHQ